MKVKLRSTWLGPHAVRYRKGLIEWNGEEEVLPSTALIETSDGWRKPKRAGDEAVEDKEPSKEKASEKDKEPEPKKEEPPPASAKDNPADPFDAKKPEKK